MGVNLKFTRTSTKYPYMKCNGAVIGKGGTISNITKGRAVYAIAWIKNIGDTGGYATLQIYNKTDNKYEAGSSKVWVPANTDDAHAIQKSCTMYMPDHDVDIELQVIYEEAADKRWIHDTEEPFHLKVYKYSDMRITSTPFLDPSSVAPGGSVKIKNVSIKNNGNIADTPRYKILQNGSVIDEFDDSAGDLAPGHTRGKEFTFTASDYTGTYTITLKVWGKNKESEPS